MCHVQCAMFRVHVHVRVRVGVGVGVGVGVFLVNGLPKRPGCLSPLVFASGDRVKSGAQGSDKVAQLLLGTPP